MQSNMTRRSRSQIEYAAVWKRCMSHEAPAVSKASTIQTNLIQSHYLTGTSKVLQLLWRT